MKKRILAMLLAVSLVVSSNSYVWAEDIETEETTIGTNEEKLQEEPVEDQSEEVEQEESEPEETSDALPDENELVEEETENKNDAIVEDNAQEEQKETEEVSGDIEQEKIETNNSSSQLKTIQNAKNIGDTFREGALTYKVNEDNISCTIIEADRTVTENIVIPQTVQGYKVTVIGAWAFEGNKSKNVQLPNGLTKIEHSAFENSELESIVIPDTVVEIGYNAFMECQNLVTVKLPTELKEISSMMFKYDEKIQEIEIPSKVEKIGFSAFEECNSISEVLMPDSIKEIESSAFLKCKNLKKVKLPKKLEVVNDWTFGYCEKLETLTWPETIKSLEDSAFAFCYNLNMQIPEGIQKIGQQAFLETAVTDVVIPDSVIDIEWNAFQGCANLQSVKIGTGLKRISGDAFSNCQKLETVKILNGMTEITGSTFYYCSMLKVLFIPRSVKKIGENAFWYPEERNYIIYYEGSETEWKKIEIADGNDSLTSEKTIIYYNQSEINDENKSKWDYKINEDGKTCTLYGREAAGSSEDLVIDKVDGYIVTEIGENAFSNDNKIKTVTLSENVQYVDKHAFKECKNLHTLTLLSKQTKFDIETFEKSVGEDIKDIYYAGSVDDRKRYYGEQNFSIRTIEAKWHYAEEKELDFKYEYKVNEDEETCTITRADPLLYGVIEIPEKIDGKIVTDIGEYAFRGAYSLTKIIFPKNLKRIEHGAFFNCRALEEIEFPESLEMIGEEAFSYCTSLKEIILPESVNDIGERAFERCLKAEKLKLPSKLKVLKAGTFNDCDNIKNIVLPSSLEKMEAYCISGSAEKIIIPGSVKIIENCALRGIETDYLTISEGTEEIESFAFRPDYWQGTFKAIALPKSLKKVSDQAFDMRNLYVYYAGSEADRKNMIVEDEFLQQAMWMYNEKKVEDYSYTFNADGNTVTISDSNIDLKGKIILPDMINGHKVTAIKAEFCMNNQEIRQIVFPKYLETIGEGSFSWCTNLNMIQFSASLMSIGQYAFDVTSLDAIRYEGSKSDKEKMELPEQEDNPLNCVEWVYNYGKTDVGPQPTVSPKPTVDPNPTTSPSPTTTPNPGGNSSTGGNSGGNTNGNGNISGAKIGGRASDALGLNWNKNAKADGYIIEQKKNGTWTRIARIADTNTTTYRVDGLSAATSYEFRIRIFWFENNVAKYGENSNVSGKTNPSSVSGLQIGEKTLDALQIKWTKNSSAEGYIVEQKKSGNWTRVARIAENTTTAYRMKNLNDNTTYEFRIQSFSFDGETPLYSEWKNVSGKTAKKNPNAVQDLKIGERAVDALRINWKQEKTAEGYIVEQYKAGNWSRIARLEGNNTVTYRVGKLNASQEYKFRICAFAFDENKAIYSTYSTISGKTNPLSVSGLQIGEKTANKLQIKWGKNSSAEGYIVEQKKSGNWTRVARIAGNTTTAYQVKNLNNNTTYEFRIQSFSFDGETPLYSEWKNVSGKTAKKNPNAVQDLKIGGRAVDALRLNWKQEKTAEGYIIEQYKAGNWSRIARLEGSSTVTYRVEKLNASQEYKFRICAFAFDENKAIYGTYSTISGKTNPSSVTGLQIAETTIDAVKLKWKQNDTADGYIIEKKEGNTWTRIARLEGKNTETYQAEKLKSNTKYEFRVQTFNFEKTTPLYGNWTYISGLTDVTNVVPDAISELKIGGRAADAIRLNWAKSRTASGYIIEQSKNGNWTRIARLEGNNVTTYRAEKLAPSANYQYRVQAFNFKDSKPVYSSWKYISGKTNPNNVTGFKVGSTKKDSLQLVWNKNTSASGYIIEQYKGGNWVRIARLEGNNVVKYDVNSLQKATTYTFRIRAFGFDGYVALYSDDTTVFGSTKAQ